MSWRDWFVRRARRSRGSAAGVHGPMFSVFTADAHTWRGVAYHAFETQSRLAEGNGAFVVCHAEGVIPTADALAEFATAIASQPDVDFVFADETGPDGKPWHKPGWSPALLLAQPYAASMFAVRRELIATVGSPRAEFGSAALYDFALRASAAARRVVHVPRLLSRTTRTPAVDEAHLRAAATAAKTSGLLATVTRCERAAVHRVSVRPHHRPPVTVIVPTRDRLDLLRTCIESVLACRGEHDLRILIVDNGSVEPATLVQLDAWRTDSRIRVLRDDAPFDYSALMNKAVAATATPLVLLLNNDTKVIAPQWLDELTGWMDLADVGAVGAKLYYADDTIQHAGVILGVGGVASHAHKGFRCADPGYHGLLHCVRDVSAVTGACLLVRRDLYLELGGMEPELRVAYNDIDFCMRLRARGYRVVWTPLAELYHFEGKSRGRDNRGQSRFDLEVSFMQTRWNAQLTHDPFHNPNLSYRATDYRLR